MMHGSLRDYSIPVIITRVETDENPNPIYPPSTFTRTRNVIWQLVRQLSQTAERSLYDRDAVMFVVVASFDYNLICQLSYLLLTLVLIWIC